MTLRQTQCHQCFPGFFSSEIFLFFHWWQTPFSSDWQDPNRYLTVFQDLYMCYWMLEVKHEQVILDWQQNIKSARPELLRNQRLRPFLRSEEMSNWKTTKSNRRSRICRTLGNRTMSQWRAMNIGSVKCVIIRHMVSSVGMATANAWEQKCGRWRNDHPSHTTKGCVPLSSDVNMKDWS